MEGKIPRRARVDLYTPAETAIYDAITKTEKIGADTRLTEAIMHLQSAKDLISDYIDEELIKVK